MASSATAPALKGRRILVVEDEYLVADHIELSLEDFGCKVVGPVPTVEEALALIADEAIDGALLDTNLDGISSAPVAVALNDRDIPFVVVTGYGSLPLATPLLEQAPRISKPFIVRELALALSGALER